jgi:hypothetical protein
MYPGTGGNNGILSGKRPPLQIFPAIGTVSLTKDSKASVYTHGISIAGMKKGKVSKGGTLHFQRR